MEEDNHDWQESSTNEVSIPSSAIRDRAPTGIQDLDREKLKGIPKGSVITVLSDPRTNGDLFGHHLACTGETNYITTLMSKEQIRESFEQFTGEDIPETVDINNIARKENLQEEITTAFDRDSSHINYVIDSLDPIKKNRYPEIVQGAKTASKNIPGLIYIYLYRNPEEPITNDNIKQMLRICDGIFEIRKQYGDTLSTTLTVPKMRNMQEVEERINLLIEDQVKIDPAMRS